MKKFLTFLIMSMIVSVAAYASKYTERGTKVSQHRVVAEVIVPNGGSNQAPYVLFTNNTDQFVEINFFVYYEGRIVDNRTVRFSGKTYKEVFNSVASMSDKTKKKKFYISMYVQYVGKPR